ncbi:MAG: phosphoribosylglycinamide formyltransferase [Oscillospiraceae bacterium]|nr:phosphoribosylglycinamide formyltransferase [Oscillospiraceae bacterium]
MQALIDAQTAGELKNGVIKAVISSNRNAYALRRAEAADIPGHVISRKDYPDAAGMTGALIDLLRRLDIDLVVLAGYLQILTPEMIQAFPNRIINIHPSLIPSFCGSGFYGLRVHEEALARGVKITGATVHFVTELPDDGPIILQKAVPVLPGDTAELLQRRVMEQAEWSILPEAVSLFCQRRLSVHGRHVTISPA